MDLPFSFILAKRDDRNVLVDTGFMQDDHSSGFARKFGIPTWISPIRMLREMNVEADAITDIIITHAHFDHMGSIAEFPNAHIYIQKSELLSWYEAFALGGSKAACDGSARRRTSSRIGPIWGAPSGRLPFNVEKYMGEGLFQVLRLRQDRRRRQRRRQLALAGDEL